MMVVRDEKRKRKLELKSTGILYRDYEMTCPRAAAGL
jgi:hypothetical protein